MSELKRVSDLTSKDVGKRLRVQTLEGAYIEGTLAGVKSVSLEQYKKHVRTWVSFEEFCHYLDGRDRTYVLFETYENRTVEEIEE